MGGSKKKSAPITIIQDTREQMPLDFSPFDGVTVEIGTVWPGDYTVKGWEKSIGFERKSVGDLIGTMKTGYVGKDSIRRYESRFDLELEEFERHYDRAFVIIEPDRPETIRECNGDPFGCDAGTQIANGWYRSAIPPATVLAFIRALTVEYGCHVYMAADRMDAAHEIVAIARMYLKTRRHVIHRGKVEQETKSPAAKDGEAKDGNEGSPF
jgi:ERCC4-type nuclease